MGKNILGDWNARRRSYGERKFWAAGTHEDDHMGKENFGLLEHTRAIWGKNILGDWNTQGLSYGEKPFGRLEHTKTIIWGKKFLGDWNTRGRYGEITLWAIGTHRDYHLGKEHFGRLVHTRIITCGNNILGVWNTQGLSFWERTFRALGTHEDLSYTEITFWAFGTHEDYHMRKEHFGRLEHTRPIILGENTSGVWYT